MNGKQLRTSILQEAIAGRLVSQNPNDEPASKLLKRIDSKFIPQETDQPHPQGWSVAPLSMLCELTDGESVQNRELINLDAKFLRGQREGNKLKSGRLVPAGSLLILVDGENSGEVFRTTIEGYQGSTFKKLVIDKNMHEEFVLQVINSHRTKLRKNKRGVAIPHLDKKLFREIQVLVPPLAEQKRIVAKIEELMPLVDEYEKAQEEFDNLNAGLKSKLRSSLLQEAIAGRLVPQNPNDEPASELLHRINPKATPLQDDVPYEIPDNWAWCRLGSVCNVARGGSPRPIERYLTDAENGVNWIKIGDTKPDDKYVRSVKQKIKPEGVSRSRFVHKGDFLLTNSMSFGRPYILDVDGCIHDGWLVISPKGGVYDKDFLYYLLSSAFAYSQFSRKVSGGVVSNLNSEKVSNSVFPLPPLAEQKRIVEKLESMFAVLDNLDALTA